MSEILNIDEKITSIDATIELQNWYIQRAEALERLKQNEDFQLVITEGLIDVEADRVYTLLLSPRTTKLEDKESYLHQLETIKDLLRYIGTDSYKGTVAILGQNAKGIIDEEMRLKQQILEGRGE